MTEKDFKTLVLLASVGAFAIDVGVAVAVHKAFFNATKILKTCVQK